MIKFLFDANLSPESAEFVRSLNYDTTSVLEENLGQISDEKVVKIAKKEKRIIITHDLDFGEIYHFKEEGKIGILVLRLKNQTVEATNDVLEKFLNKKVLEKRKLEKSLIIINEFSYRVYKN